MWAALEFTLTSTRTSSAQDLAKCLLVVRWGAQLQVSYILERFGLDIGSLEKRLVVLLSHGAGVTALVLGWLGTTFSSKQGISWEECFGLKCVRSAAVAGNLLLLNFTLKCCWTSI